MTIKRFVFTARCSSTRGGTARGIHYTPPPQTTACVETSYIRRGFELTLPSEKLEETFSVVSFGGCHEPSPTYICNYTINHQSANIPQLLQPHHSGHVSQKSLFQCSRLLRSDFCGQPAGTGPMGLRNRRLRVTYNSAARAAERERETPRPRPALAPQERRSGSDRQSQTFISVTSPIADDSFVVDGWHQVLECGSGSSCGKLPSHL